MSRPEIHLLPMNTVSRLLLLGLVLGVQACSGLGSWNRGSQVISAPGSEAVAAAAPEPDPLPDRPVGPTDYLVRKGDTVYSIAFRSQVDYREMAKWNNIGSDYRIYPGQVLRLTPPSMARVGSGDLMSQPIEDEPSAKPVAVAAGAPKPVTAAPPPVAAEPQPGTKPNSGAPGWYWPTDGVVVRGFAPDQGSRGLDFGGDVGQPVRAAASGKVVYSGSALKGYGELVIIKHDDLHLSAYGYNSKRLVKEGDVVTAGQQIAELGLGPESKPVLHFEIREKGKPVDPVPFLPAKTASN